MPGCPEPCGVATLAIRWSPIPPSTGERNDVSLCDTLGSRRSRYRLTALSPLLFAALARGGAYCFGGGSRGSRAGSGLILARIAFRVLMRSERK
jgi:hypothetical protein